MVSPAPRPVHRPAPRGTAPAEIGLEQRALRGPRSQVRQGRHRETCDLPQPIRLGGVELASAGPASTLSAPTASSCDGPNPVSQPPPALIGAAPAKASASITPRISARHRKVRRAMIGCGTVSASAPPAVAGHQPATACRARQGNGQGQSTHWPRRQAGAGGVGISIEVRITWKTLIAQRNQSAPVRPCHGSGPGSCPLATAASRPT